MSIYTKIIIIAGPTATGKTDLAVKLAGKFNGELVNADSRQIYKYMDIGTNKDRVQGQIFDVVEPDEEFNVSAYVRLATETIGKIAAAGKLPILVGGTGLYIDALIKHYRLPGNQPDWKLRNKLAKLTAEGLLRKLRQLDNSKANQLNESDRRNPRRLIRLIELARGKQLPELLSDQKSSLPEYVYLMLYPKFSRQELYQRIDHRVMAMFAAGFIAETEKLIKMGYAGTKPMQGMGYREICKYLQGEMTLSECQEKIKQAHRNYAARQITWFEGKGRGYKLQKFAFAEDYQEITAAVKKFLK